MKNQHMLRRFLYAWAGLRISWRTERSFRADVIAVACTVLLLLITRPAPIWWALLLLAGAIMIAVELINTAVEKLADHLHPQQHEIVGIVKDTLAGAVFVSCVAGGVVLCAFLWTLVAG